MSILPSICETTTHGFGAIRSQIANALAIAPRTILQRSVGWLRRQKWTAVRGRETTNLFTDGSRTVNDGRARSAPTLLAEQPFDILLGGKPERDRAVSFAVDELLNLGSDCFDISSGVPLAMIVPARLPAPSMIIFVPMRKALVMSWVTTTAVMSSLRVRSRVSWSITAVMMGSRPEVGSSLKSNSGSSATARASPTRLRILR